MECTDFLNAGNLCERNKETMLRLLAENSQCEKIKNAILEFAEDPRIDSCGIRSLKRQLEDYIIIIDAVKHANMTDIEEYVVANTIIGSEDLDGSAVTRREQEIELKKISDANASWYRWEYHHARLDPLNDGSYYYDMMKMYEAESEEHQKEIDECTRIILKYDAIEYSTKLLLAHGTQHREYIADALEAMGKAFDGSDYNPYVSEYWRNTLAHKNPQKIYNCLKAEGVTDEQIANMQEKGFSLDEIWFYVKSCTNEETRDFMSKIMSKKYDEAFFEVNPDDIDSIAYYFATDYAIHMIHYDSTNKCVLQNGIPEDLDDIEEFDEIEEYCNAVLKSFENRQWYDSAGNLISVSYRADYLENLALAAEQMTLIQADQVARMRPIDPGFKEQMAEYYRTKAILSLFSGEKALYDIYTDLSLNYGNFNNQFLTKDTSVKDIAISNLNFGIDAHGHALEGEINFDVTQTPLYPYYGERTDKIKITTLSYPDNMQKTSDWEALRDARIYQETAGTRMFTNILRGMTLTALAYAAPEYGAAFSFCSILANRGGQLYINSNNLAGQEAISVGGDTITGLFDIYEAKQSLNITEQKILFKTFGGGFCLTPEEGGECLSPDDKTISSCGVYSPGELHVIKEWQENGMENWVTFDINPDTGQEYTTNEVLILCQENCSDPKVLDMCEKLLLGSDNILQDISESGMETYTDATDLIEEYGRISDNTINSQYEALAKKFDAGIDVGF